MKRFVLLDTAAIPGTKGALNLFEYGEDFVIKIAGGKVSTLAGNSIIDPCSPNIAGRAQEGNKDGPVSTNVPHSTTFAAWK